MPTKEDLEQQLEREQRKVQLLGALVQRLQRKLQDLSGDVQAYVQNTQTQLNELEAADDE